MLSIPHLVVIFVVVLVVFGPQKLPELARTLGRLMAEFRKASGDFRLAFEEEMRDLERQSRERERKTKSAAPAGEPAAGPFSEMELPATAAGESSVAAQTLPRELTPDPGLPATPESAPTDSGAQSDPSSKEHTLHGDRQPV